MKSSLYWFFALTALFVSQNSYAISQSCQNELRELIIPSLQHVFVKKRDIHVEMEDHARGVYSVRLFVPADSPDNLDKQVSIGWVNLDTNTMQALDVTRDPDHPDILKVDGGKYKNFVSMCISDLPKSEGNCEQLNATASKKWEPDSQQYGRKDCHRERTASILLCPRSILQNERYIYCRG